MASPEIERGTLMPARLQRVHIKPGSGGWLVVFTAVLLVSSERANAQPAAQLPFVSPIFSDNMVLQRGKPNTIWGWSQPEDTVRVEIGENSATATAGADGRWQARIQPPAPGGP